MLILGVYEDDEYEQCIFVGTYKEIAEEFKMSYSSLRTTLCRKQKIQGRKGKRYSIYKLYEEKGQVYGKQSNS